MSDYEYEWTENRRQQVTCWCFTLNNYTVDEGAELRVLGESGDCKYLIVGKEVGEQGTPHLQCFVQFNAKKTMGGVTKLLPKRCAKVRPMYPRSSPYACFKYCSKDENFIEYGARPEPPGVPGRKRQTIDYSKAITLAREDKLDELEQMDPGLFLRYHRTFGVIRDTAPRAVAHLEGCCGLWIIGPPGTGKTHWVRKRYGDDIFEKSMSKWWCEYRGEQYVFINDLDKMHSSWAGSYLKRWTDRFSFKADRKCLPSIIIRPKLICVDANYTIDEMFATVCSTMVIALQQRFKVVIMDRIRPTRPHVLDEEGEIDPYADEDEDLL